MKSILVLEDEPCVMAVLRNVLSHRYTVIETVTAAEAFQEFSEHTGHIDLLIADALLPVSSGIQVALALYRRLPILRVILMSGTPEHLWPVAERAQLAEVSSDVIEILEKPFSPALLLKTVRTLLGTPVPFTLGRPLEVRCGVKIPDSA